MSSGLITLGGSSVLILQNESTLKTNSGTSMSSKATFKMYDNAIFKSFNSFQMYEDAIFVTSGFSRVVMNVSTNNLVVPEISLTTNAMIILNDYSYYYSYCPLKLYTNSSFTLNGNGIAEINNSVEIKDTSKLILNDQSGLTLQSLTLYSSSRIKITGSATFETMNTILFVDSSSLVVSDFSVIVMNYAVFSAVSSLQATGNARFIVDRLVLSDDVQITANKNTTFEINNLTMNSNTKIFLRERCSVNINVFMTLTANPVFEMYDESVVVVKDVGVLSQATIKLYNTSYIGATNRFLVDGSSTLNVWNSSVVNAVNFTVSGNAKVYLYGSSKLIATNIIILTGSTQIRVYSNSLVKTQNMVITTGASIYLEGNMDEKEVELTTSIDAQNYNIYITGNAWAEAESCLLNGGTFNVHNRTIRDIPLIQTIFIYFSNANTVVSEFDFDIAFSKNESPIIFTAHESLTPLKDKKLIRYGHSTRIYCHLVYTSNNTYRYLESYCPCDDDDKYTCYITPLKEVTAMRVDIENIKESNSMKMNRIHSNYKSEEGNVGDINNENIYVGEQQKKICVVKTDNLVLYIKNNNLIPIEIENVTKGVLLISYTLMQINNKQCQICHLNASIVECTKCVNTCEDNFYDVTTKSCVDCVDLNCEKCSFNANSCIECKNRYYPVNGKCVNDTNCQLVVSKSCIKCKDGFVLLNGICEINNDCILLRRDGSCAICNTTKNTFNKDGICVEIEHAEVINQKSVVSCNSGYLSNTTTCIKCGDVYPNTLICEYQKSTKCDSLSEMNINKTCELTNCEHPNDLNGKCTTELLNCQSVLNAKCVECPNKMLLNGETCVLNDDEKCIKTYTSGCARCGFGFYYNLITQRCEKCNLNCETCYYNSTFCMSCRSGTFLSEHNCITNEDLRDICMQFVPSGGCVKCVNGYYRNGLSCDKCDVKCESCYNTQKCLTCNTTNYMTINNDCKPQNLIVGCQVEVTQNGCSKCEDSYFQINQNECDVCDTNCKTCSSKQMCLTCDSSRVLINSICTEISSILDCNKIEDSKCTKCSFWKAPNEEGTACDTKAVWWVLLIVIVISVLFVILSILVVIVTTNHIITKIHQNEVEKMTTIFPMKRSNVQFKVVSNGVCVSPSEINLNSEIEDFHHTEEKSCLCGIQKTHIEIHFS
ncbi:hypothetical protein EIN_139780 [Entamoeba invadens IP1]|uniref:Uncharacterized protein n=1 Tax=Entamoeba invadens IP1 TaxID=370355 RepID=A0A0A1TV21_ENTIV|nr:hypothetical protein EIN_139780 [Entamoeba invadens IP1]ELP84131.1 hypothetical protein EIN_139780 [Entamoeba invadens IP1]|eukprot:XP_004183477.1 hypothetical protein EIN_139780 [Entamoeba invadens IP1]